MGKCPLASAIRASSVSNSVADRNVARSGSTTGAAESRPTANSVVFFYIQYRFKLHLLCFGIHFMGIRVFGKELGRHHTDIIHHRDGIMGHDVIHLSRCVRGEFDMREAMDFLPLGALFTFLI